MAVIAAKMGRPLYRLCAKLPVEVPERPLVLGRHVAAVAGHQVAHRAADGDDPQKIRRLAQRLTFLLWRAYIRWG